MAQARQTVTSEPTAYYASTRMNRGEILFGGLEKDRMRNLTGATDEIWRDFPNKYVPLRHDLSWFMRLLKQRFARWLNAFHKPFWTLWAERFTSVMVEGAGAAGL